MGMIEHAFPFPSVSGHPGMTLRDYFAGQAMAAIPIRSWDHISDGDLKIKAWAVAAYAVADEMLKVRGSE